MFNVPPPQIFPFVHEPHAITPLRNYTFKKRRKRVLKSHRAIGFQNNFFLLHLNGPFKDLVENEEKYKMRKANATSVYF